MSLMPVGLVVAVPASADQLPVTISNTAASRFGSAAPAPPIAPGFVGASIDYCSITLYDVGTPAETVLVNLLGGIAPTQPVLRIGGSGPLTGCPDWAHRPLQATTGAIAGLTRRLGAKLILGLNLESHDPSLVRWEAAALLHAIDPGPHYRYIEAFELGNEPDLFPRYGPNSPESSIPHYFDSYLQDFSHWAEIVRQVAKDPSFGIAGPSLGRLGLPWISGIYASNFFAFINGPAQPRYVTFHTYPLIATMPCPAINCPLLENLMTDSASHGLAEQIAPFALAAPPGREVRVDEMNSDTLGGLPGISNTFASALWALDTLFEMAQAGVVGVNFHTFPGAGYELFSRVSARTWLIHPEYYGLLMFTRAAPAGSRLLQVTPDLAEIGGPNVKVWATAGPDRKTRILIINKDSHAHDVVLGGTGLPPSGTAAVERLQATPVRDEPGCLPAYSGTGLCATSGVMLGGRRFGPPVAGTVAGDQTSTGVLAQPAPCKRGQSCLLPVSSAGTIVPMPAASAALLTIG